ncbi:hypothetical protein DFP72DRAFT_1166076 [Ephemerocybe angulata]|uniref:Uncharacterized protein n=1 Tax=Ephemerocybe angulata TaxID=980116 RepID=A0A8H6MC30_9AGAR|nr:hypothetical protein DFP72DRAFT_1166076 [Tulosesus angulatus]
MHMRGPGISISQLLLCLFVFLTSFQSLHAVPLPAHPGLVASIRKGVKGSAELKAPKAPPVSPSTSAPRPEIFLVGQFAGVRVKSYETASKVDTIHPGIVVEGPNANREYLVVMMSSNLPGNPPQKPISKYQSGTGLAGSVSLVPILVPWSKMKIWRQRGSGNGAVQPALSPAKVTELLTDIRNAGGSSRG